MQGVFGITEDKANVSNVNFVSEQKSDDKSVGEDWFSNACKHLLPAKAGTALHYATGFDERSCQRYAAGHTAPPAYFFLLLLRSPQGLTWLRAAMAGCNEQWWCEIQFAHEMVAVMEAKRKELLNGGDPTSTTRRA